TGTVDTCYYNKKKDYQVQWEHPSSKTGLILILVAAGITLISVGVLIVVCKHIQKSQIQKPYQDL
ncbi:unnamed protein product, partial [Didymodactylos carnosus]